jgi:beta-lactamase class A
MERLDGGGLQRDLEEVIARLKGVLDAEVKVSVHDIPSGAGADVDGGRPGWAASIIKLPVLVMVARAAVRGDLALDDLLTVDHRFVLDPTDPVSRLPAGTRVPVEALLDRMIVDSDNEATNILADRLGIERINGTAWDLGLERTMLGHLLCRGVPRHRSAFNPDGSNLSCPADMTLLLRHIYEAGFSRLAPAEREISDRILSGTESSAFRVGKFRPLPIKAKRGFIRDPVDGIDAHEVGIIAGRLIVSVFLNKVGRKRPGPQPAGLAFHDILWAVERRFA